MSRDRRRVLSYEERVLWTTVTQSMTPLHDAPPVVQDLAAETDDAKLSGPKLSGLKSSGPKPPGPMAKKHKPQAASRSTATAPPYTPPQHKPPPSGNGPGLAPLTRRMKRSVARGKEAIDARLDLHGLTQHEAHDTLLRFLRTASARDARLVLVITGKGRISGKRNDSGGDRERGVLRRQVPQWLSLPEFRAYVAGFEDAAIAHGGEGALYVRVRRGQPV
ncbi:MAG: Smr/MutS family protein [Pseudolabrys sp.]|nr:Smr/MutS family protein [Pseudolabrys sp.]